jgi:hypothetical protein
MVRRNGDEKNGAERKQDVIKDTKQKKDVNKKRKLICKER